jgi:hypothetical protein
LSSWEAPGPSRGTTVSLRTSKAESGIQSSIWPVLKAFQRDPFRCAPHRVAIRVATSTDRCRPAGARGPHPPPIDHRSPRLWLRASQEVDTRTLKLRPDQQVVHLSARGGDDHLRTSSTTRRYGGSWELPLPRTSRFVVEFTYACRSWINACTLGKVSINSGRSTK